MCEYVGAMSILEQKDHGIEGNNRYRVWIKAEVKYEFKPKHLATAKTEIMDVNVPLTVKVWSENVYHSGPEGSVQAESLPSFRQGKNHRLCR